VLANKTSGFGVGKGFQSVRNARHGPASVQFSQTTMFKGFKENKYTNLMGQTSLGTSNVSLNSKLTRSDRNQRTLDGIKDSTRKMKTELN
jgi:hypothetical protein